MTLTQLEYFCMVCRYHSITRAADALYVSQPTISTSIRDLEKEFHLKLFNHGKNRIFPHQRRVRLFIRKQNLF